MTTAAKPRTRSVCLTPDEARAAAARRLTEIRREVKPQPMQLQLNNLHYGWTWIPRQDGPWYCFKHARSVDAALKLCPLGSPGDVLLGRETWRCNHVAGMRIEYRAGGACLEYHDWPKDVIPPYVTPDAPAQVRRTIRQLNGERIPDAWRSPGHLPAWAVRFRFTVLTVRIEQAEGKWWWVAGVGRIGGEA